MDSLAFFVWQIHKEYVEMQTRGKCGATVQQRDLYKVCSPVPPAQAVVLLYMQVPCAKSESSRAEI